MHSPRNNLTSKVGGDLASALVQALADVRAATTLEAAHSRLKWAEMLASSLLQERRNAPQLASHAEALMKLARAGGVLENNVEALARSVEQGAVPGPVVETLLQSEQAYASSLTNRASTNSPAPISIPDIRPQDLAPHIANIFPQASVNETIRISGGYSKRTFLIRLTLATGHERELILRQDLLGGPPFGTSVIDEFRLLEALAKTDLPAARPLLLVRGGTKLGGAFIITEKLPGRTVGRNVIGFDSLGDKRSIALAIAALLADVHSVDTTTIVPAAQIALSGEDRVRQRIDHFQQLWMRHRHRPSLPLALAYQWLQNNLKCGVGGSSLIHGDVSLANILVTGTRVTGLVDWEFWHIGDPAEDLAYCRSVMQTAVPWEEFLSAYLQAGGQEITASRFAFLSVFYKFRLAIMCRISGEMFASGEVSDPVYAASAAAIAPALEAEMLEEIASISQEMRLCK